MKRTLSRTLALLLILALCGLAACETSAPGANGQTSGGEVRVYNWGDYIDEEVIQIFENETGIKVVYDTFDTNESMFGKVANSPGYTYDVVIPSDYMIKRMIDADMLAELDFSNIPNFSLIGDQYKSKEYDPADAYSVPYMWGTVGILYNTTMVDKPVNSWRILWDEDFTKNLYMMDSVRDSIGVTLKMLGYSLNSTDIAQLEAAEAELVAQKPLVLAYTGDEVKDAMIGGNAALSVVYSGDATTCILENPDLAYAVPEEGTNLWFDAMCILKTAENKENGEKFIDFMCRTDIAEMNREYINYSTPQTEVFEALPDEIRNDPGQYPTEDVIEKSEVFVDLGETVAYYDDLWWRVKLS
ncbi:ABC transporter substrate-binding protein [Oscillospiraceae bacterium OttesenSCG-928-F05]|nr:ABC transporter substrate-binding protein [Oscillospiraceae bacterium OttesenSCG-928-F05]